MHESSEVKVREIQCGGCRIQLVLQPAEMRGERERKGVVKHGITYWALSGYTDSASWETCCGDHAAGLPADISVHFSSVSDSALFSSLPADPGARAPRSDLTQFLLSPGNWPLCCVLQCLWASPA